MKKNGILSGAVKLLSGLKIEGLAHVGRTPDRFGKADFGVLQVAMMISALDGNVQDDELAAFDRLAKKCVGYTPESAAAALDAGLRAAGYLTLQAKRLKEKDLVAKFVDEAVAAMPEGFAIGRPEPVRRAFVMWTAMAMSDGDYSAVERKAITALLKRIGEIMAERDAAERGMWREIAPAYAVACSDEHQTFESRKAPSADFMAKVEVLLAKLRRESSADDTLKALKALILKG